MFKYVRYLKFSSFQEATKKQQKFFFNYIFGLTNAKNVESYFQTQVSTLETDSSRYRILMDMINAIHLLDYYRSLLEGENNLKDRDRNQLFFLKNPNPRNHMPAFCIINNHHEPLSKGLFPETYGFIRLQMWQHFDKFLVQHLQNHYTVVCISIFQFLQKYLENRAVRHPKIEESVVLTKGSDRERFDANIGKDNIFLLFKVFKKLKKQVIAYEQTNKDSLVVKLKTSPFPVFFWNCDEFYPLEFNFKVLKKKGTISFDLLERFFDWDFIDAYE